MPNYFIVSCCCSCCIRDKRTCPDSSLRLLHLHRVHTIIFSVGTFINRSTDVVSRSWVLSSIIAVNLMLGSVDGFESEDGGRVAAAESISPRPSLHLLAFINFFFDQTPWPGFYLSPAKHSIVYEAQHHENFVCISSDPSSFSVLQLKLSEILSHAESKETFLMELGRLP